MAKWLDRRRAARSGTCPAGCAPLSTGGCDCPYIMSSSMPVAGAQASLGLIPSHQFAHDADINIGLWNPHLKFPPGMNQLTVQPTADYYPTSGDANLQGLGVTMAQWLPPAASGAGISGMFESGWWRNRKWIAVGVVSLLGIGIAALATKVLR